MATAASQAARRKGSASKKVVPDEAAPGSLGTTQAGAAGHHTAAALRFNTAGDDGGDEHSHLEKVHVPDMSDEAAPASAPHACKEMCVASCTRHLIDPRSDRMKQWDVVMVVCLLFTAAVTPYEVAFLETEWNALFWLNRLIDLLFVGDMVKNFVCIYFDSEEQMWVRNPWRIAKHYLKGWFTVDLASILPLDTVGLVMQNDDMQGMKGIRIIRLLRLLKLLRIMRAMRILERWEDLIAVSYAVIALVKFFLMVVVLAHWSACLLRLVPSLEVVIDPTTQRQVSWLRSLGVNGFDSGEWECDTNAPDCVCSNGGPTIKGDDGLYVCRAGNSQVYLAAIYWALMTITTIGYGDIALVTDGERIMGMTLMVIGGGVYAYIVGAVCGVLANMDEATTIFHNTMDSLNAYAEDVKLPMALRIRLRAYFRNCRELTANQNNKSLLVQMSPTLRSEVALFVNATVLRRVHFFKTDDDQEYFSFVTQLTLMMEPAVYAPKEVVITQGQVLNDMYLIKRGLAGENGRIRASGDFFATEGVLLECKARHMVVAVVFLHVFKISRQAVQKVMKGGGYPSVADNMRRQKVVVCFQRGIQDTLAAIAEQGGAPGDGSLHAAVMRVKAKREAEQRRLEAQGKAGKITGAAVVGKGMGSRDVRSQRRGSLGASHAAAAQAAAEQYEGTSVLGSGAALPAGLRLVSEEQLRQFARQAAAEVLAQQSAMAAPAADRTSSSGALQPLAVASSDI